jgi:chloride channel 2
MSGRSKDDLDLPNPRKAVTFMPKTPRVKRTRALNDLDFDTVDVFHTLAPPQPPPQFFTRRRDSAGNDSIDDNDDDSSDDDDDDDEHADDDVDDNGDDMTSGLVSGARHGKHKGVGSESGAHANGDAKRKHKRHVGSNGAADGRLEKEMNRIMKRMRKRTIGFWGRAFYASWQGESSATHEKNNTFFFFFFFFFFCNSKSSPLELIDKTLLFMALLGTLTAVTAWAVDATVWQLYFQQTDLKLIVRQATGSDWPGYFVWCGLAIVSIWIANLCVHKLSRNAAGSGIPEMKSILSGVLVSRYLSSTTFIAKLIGLICARNAGLYIGQEGPYVHLASCYANQLLKRVPWFSRMNANEGVRQQLLGAACAVGVASAFGTLVGGVIFSIEVTSSFYLVNSLWKGFFVALWAAMIVRIIGSIGVYSMFTHKGGDPVPWQLVELPLFALVGIVGGAVAAGFVKSLLLLIGLARRPFFSSRIGIPLRTALIVVFISMWAYPFAVFRSNNRDTLDYLLGYTPLNTLENPIPQIPEWVFLCLLVVVRFVGGALSIGFADVPCGVFAPVFITGAALGRLVGVGAASISLTSHPMVYALCGAAAVSAGTTHTLSTAIIIVEMTGRIELVIPLLIGVLFGIGAANLLQSASIYDVLLVQKGLPHMPKYQSALWHTEKAVDIMRTEIVVLSTESTFDDAATVLNDASHNHRNIPVVDTKENMIFLGAVDRADLRELLKNFRIDYKNKLVPLPRSDGTVTPFHGTDGTATPLEAADGPVELAAEERAPPNGSTAMAALELDMAGGGGARSATSLRDSQPVSAPGTPPAPGTATGSLDRSFPTPPAERGVGSVPLQPLSRRPTNATMRRDRGLSMALWPRQALLRMTIPFGIADLDRNTTPDDVPVDQGTLALNFTTPIYRVWFVFTMLGLGHCWVTDRGKLVGVITKKDLIRMALESAA